MRDSGKKESVLLSQLKKIKSGDEFTVQHHLRNSMDLEGAGGPPYDVWYFVNKKHQEDPAAQSLMFVYPATTENEGDK